MRAKSLIRSKPLLVTLTVGAALALALAASTAASARPGGPGGKAMGKRGPGARLGLSDSQRAELKKLRQAKRATVAPIRAQMQIKRAEIEALWLAERVDRGAVLRAMNDLQALRAQVAEAKVDFKLAALQLMTPEQKLKFLERGKRGKRGFKRGFGRRGGKHHFRGGRFEGQGPGGAPDAAPEGTEL